MNRNKCKGCGLVNPSGAATCKRCGKAFDQRSMYATGSIRGPREAAKRGSFIYTIAFLAMVSAIMYYLFLGFQKSYNDIQLTEANRLAAQPSPQPALFTSRSESDQKRIVPYKTAIQNSPGLAASQQHMAETQKLMEPDPPKTKK